MPPVSIPLLGALILLVFTAASCGQDRRAWTEEDEWHRPVPREDRPARWWSTANEVPRERIIEVPEDAFPEAESMLRDTTIMQLTENDLSRLGVAVNWNDEGDLYLVRAVYLNRYTGGFSVTYRGDTLLVHHGSLGRQAVPMQRTALILPLNIRPQVVYVETTMTE